MYLKALTLYWKKSYQCKIWDVYREANIIIKESRTCVYISITVGIDISLDVSYIYLVKSVV